MTKNSRASDLKETKSMLTTQTSAFASTCFNFALNISNALQNNSLNNLGNNVNNPSL